MLKKEPIKFNVNNNETKEWDMQVTWFQVLNFKITTAASLFLTFVRI